MPGWGDDPSAPFDEGVLIWDLADPTLPSVVGRYRTGGNGTHRNFYAGGRYVHLACAAAGFDGHIYEILDIADPSAPRPAGRWWVPGQWRDGGEAGVPDGTSLHAPYVVGDRAYLAYGAAGLVILDIADPLEPRLVSRLDFAPPFNPVIATHTAMPLPGRDLVAVNSEAIEEDCAEPLDFAGLVDIADEAAPRVISMFPQPAPPPGASYRNFCERGGRFGPHNLHQAQGQPGLEDRSDRLYLTYFNAGLRVIDIADPRLPREIGSFVPPDPVERRGVLPRTLVGQSEDVLVDSPRIHLRHRQEPWRPRPPVGRPMTTEQPSVRLFHDTTRDDIFQVDRARYGRLADTAGRTSITRFEVPIRDGRAWPVRAGQVCRITTVDGPQAGDLNAWSLDDPRERFWAARTRMLEGSHVTTFSQLWSTRPFHRPMLTLIADTLPSAPSARGARCHDLLGTGCDPFIWKLKNGVDFDRTCYNNLARAIAPWHLTEFDVHDVVNLFMSTGLDPSTGMYFMEPVPAKAGDYVELFAEIDVLIGPVELPGRGHLDPTPGHRSRRPHADLPAARRRGLRRRSCAARGLATRPNGSRPTPSMVG